MHSHQTSYPEYRRIGIPLLVFPQALRDVVALIRAGGVTINTTAPQTSEHLLCRTVIQIDGDIVAYVDPSVTFDSPEWHAHLRQIEARILNIASVFREATGAARYLLTIGFATIALSLGGVSTYEVNNWIGLGIPVMLSILAHFGLQRIFPTAVTWLGGVVLGVVARRIKHFGGLESQEEYGLRALG